jgi:hypothetical protein
MQKAKLIDVSVRQDETLWIAGSSAIRGMIVTARTKDEVIAKVPGAIKEMLGFVGDNWVVTECENPEVIGAEFAFAAIPAEAIR